MSLLSLRYGLVAGKVDDRFFQILRRTVRSNCGHYTPMDTSQIGTHSVLEQNPHPRGLHFRDGHKMCKFLQLTDPSADFHRARHVSINSGGRTLHNECEL